MPTYKDIKKILKKNGATIHRQGKGSHVIWILNGIIIPVPNHNSKDLSRGLYLQLLKDIEKASKGK